MKLGVHYCSSYYHRHRTKWEKKFLVFLFILMGHRVGRYDDIVPCDGIQVSTGRNFAMPFIPEKGQMSAASL